jgi:D-sedoheptulose 7-phosphate isomerase
MSERVYTLFQRSVEAKMQVGESVAPAIGRASDVIIQALLNERKILICGNGLSAALAQMFTATLADRFERERPGLPAIWLGSNLTTYTAIATENGINDVYAKSIKALGQDGDVLVVISTTGNSANLIHAVEAARDRGMTIIALTGGDGGDISRLLDVNGVEIRAELNSRTRLHEVHLLCIFCICDLIDNGLFGIE